MVLIFIGVLRHFLSEFKHFSPNTYQYDTLQYNVFMLHSVSINELIEFLSCPLHSKYNTK